MKFFIPDIKFRLRLTEDYDAHLLNDGVNTTILHATPDTKKQIEEARAKIPASRWSVSDENEWIDAWADYNNKRFKITFPKDTLLSVARVYIRKGASDYSSVTFNILECPLKRYTLKSKGGTWNWGTRNFFLHLHQLDTLEFEPA